MPPDGQVWALFGILEIGNIIEEPFTATEGLLGSKLYVLPLTEVCRTIRRDVRFISSYQTRCREYNVPTIVRRPSTAVDPPESFGQMRQMAAEAEAAAKEAEKEEEAAKLAAEAEAAAKGGQAYLRTTTANASGAAPLVESEGHQGDGAVDDK